MRNSLVPLALLVLAACSGDSPADDADQGPSTDTAPASEDIAQPQPSPDPADDMEGEPDADGNRWFYKADSRTALFGPPQSEGALSIGCGPSGTNNGAITVIRYTAAQAEGEQVLDFTSESASASVQVSAEAMELGPDYVWQGTVSPPASDLRRVFTESESTISVRLESGDVLEVRPSEAVVRAIDACS